MVKLRGVGKFLLGAWLIGHNPSFETLRSVNTGFALGNWVSTTSDFNLTAKIDVDYSLTDWFRNT